MVFQNVKTLINLVIKTTFIPATFNDRISKLPTVQCPGRDVPPFIDPGMPGLSVQPGCQTPDTCQAQARKIFALQTSDGAQH